MKVVGGMVRRSLLCKDLLTGLFEGSQIKGFKKESLSAFVQKLAKGWEV